MKCCNSPVTSEEESHRERSATHDLFNEILAETEVLHLKFSSVIILLISLNGQTISYLYIKLIQFGSNSSNSIPVHHIQKSGENHN